MKTKVLILIILSLLFSATIEAQNKGIRYKAIITDAGTILKKAPISVKFTFLENGETKVYTETHETLTNKNGLINLTIGKGRTSDDFDALNWSESQFLKVEVDYGSGYVHISTTDYKEVPYALYANTAKELENPLWFKDEEAVNTTDAVGIGVKEIDKNAILEISSTDKGLLIPRLEIKDLSMPYPLSAHVEGMVVYNTKLGQEGLYYNDGERWVKSNEESNKDNKTCVNPIQVVNNISEMKALGIPTNSCINYIEVLGYYTPGDGGGGSFFFDSGSTEGVNNGTIFKRDSNNQGRFYRLFSGALNVRWFGAKSNTTTNQSSAFQATINATRIMQGNKIIGSKQAVFIPSGEYLINSTLNMHIGLEIKGESMYSTMLKKTNGGSDAVIQNLSNNTFGHGGRTQLSTFSIRTNSKLGIRYETFDKKYPYTAKFNRLEIVSDGYKGIAISIEGLSHAEFNSVFCSGRNDGIGFKVSGKTYNTGIFAFSNCKFGGTTSDGSGDRVGFWFAEGTALDAFVFNSCFFAGQQFCELIGNGYNNVVGITHNACHYEMNHSSKYNYTSIIKFDGADGDINIGGAISCSWTDCVFGALSPGAHFVIDFERGHYTNIRFVNNRFLMNSNNYAFMLHDDTHYKSCFIGGVSGVAPNKIFAFNSINHLDNWHGYNDTTYAKKSQSEVPFNKFLMKDNNKLDYSIIPIGKHEVGEIIYNTKPNARDYVGWVCVEAGTPGVWKGFGLIEN